MPRSCPRVLLAGRTTEDRKRNRAGVSLRAYTIADKTRKRYEVAVRTILPLLEENGLLDADALISEWMELQWDLGTAVNTIADCLSGLH